jgi:hypothetical protein
MNISVTIPQMFYDLIARAIPGFLFLVMLGFVLTGTGEASIAASLSGMNSVTAIVIALAAIVLAYLLGWVLHAFTFLSASSKARAKYESKKNKLSISDMYNWIRIKDEVVGFRITKLRAEARMLEVSRSGLIYITAIAAGLLALHKLAVLPMDGQSPLGWGVKLGVPLLMAIAFWKLERRAWEKYYGAVGSHYKILFKK